MLRHATSTHVAAALGIVALCLQAQAAYAATPDYKTYHTQQKFQARIDFAAVNVPLLNEAICHETNVERAKHGRRALPTRPVLEKAAQLHADLMVRDGFFAHQHPSLKEYKTPMERNRLAGVLNPKPAENIAVVIGFPYKSKQKVYGSGRGNFSLTPNGPLLKAHTYVGLARAALNQWMNSPGHRKNILSASAVSMGCAARFTWHDVNFPAFKAVQNFQFYEPVRTGASSEVQATVQVKEAAPAARPPKAVVQKQAPQTKTTRRTRRVVTTTTTTKIVDGKKTVEVVEEVQEFEE